MRRRAMMVLPGLVLIGLVGCGGAEPPPDKAEAQAKGRDTDATVFDDLIQTEDKARAVEGVTMAQKAATDAAIEAQSGGSPPDDPE
jgi:hypothetical protein